MANNNNLTIFDRLNWIFRGGSNHSQPSILTAPTTQSNRVIFSTNDRNEYEKKLSTLRQQKYLSYVWKKASAENALNNLNAYTGVRLMYHDADLMDGTPEIGTTLDIVAEESCPLSSDGKMINIYSKSNRVKSILEDLFVNRLHCYTELPMIARHLAKYGNTFMLHNIDKDNGIMGWTMLPVYEVDRIENGCTLAYGNAIVNNNTNDIKPDEVQFVWNGRNDNMPYKNWQVSHFRLLNDSFFLPYGVSMLHKARRSWRMWSMMEDAMLIWRLDKAIERRIFKIYVGGIDDADVEAYVNDIANNFKRTPVVDPDTGQLDLKKNFLDVSSDYFIPVRREDAPTPIETLQGANSQVQMEDIEYMQNKMFAALRVPKTYLNFQEAQGKGQNLAILDIRFSRMINRIQQFLIMELNKIAMIHLYMLGLQDELSNFTISLNNPSSQIEAQELDDLTKRITLMASALADPGNGMPIFSLHKALKDIMKMSDSEIKDMLQEIRLEKAMVAELEKTSSIIKKTGIFDNVDRLYGDYDALNGDQNAQAGGEENSQNGGMGGGGGAMPPMGDDMDMDMGEPGSEDGGDIGGTAGETDMEGAPEADAGPLNEQRKKQIKNFTKSYFDLLSENDDKETPTDFDVINEIMNNKLQLSYNKIASIVEEVTKNEENEKLINEVKEDLTIID